MKLLKNKVAIITGAGGGIGRGIALSFAKQGACVVVAECNRETGNAVVDELTELGSNAKFMLTDIADLESVRRVVAETAGEFGSVDILVNNAYPTMKYFPDDLEAIDDDRLQDSMMTGFHSVAVAMRAAMPHMKAKGWGRIINICSLNGVNAHKYSADYNSAKEAVRAYTRTAAAEWAQYGITANIICPGAKTTPFERLKELAPELVKDAEAINPMGRLGDPESDIGGAALCIASDFMGYVTGNTFFVDGGSHINGVPWGATKPDFSKLS